MEYKVVPFKPNLEHGQSSAEAAAQVQSILNEHSNNGWQFLQIANVQTYIGGLTVGFDHVVEPGHETNFQMLLFKK